MVYRCLDGNLGFDHSFQVPGQEYIDGGTYFYTYLSRVKK